LARHSYVHFDVFTDHPFTGNQLAVFPNAAGLDSDVMQRIAAEIGFSETSFVFPAETTTTDVRVRIFTPAVELPIAGHPTIGTAFGLAHVGLLAPGRGIVIFGLGVGPTPVQLEWQSNQLQFAWMTQPVPKFGATPTDLKALAAALGIGEGDIRESMLPVQEVSSGVPLLFVPLVSRRAVDAVVVDRTALQRFYQAAGMSELPVFVFSLEAAGDDATVFSRMFAPVFGIAEDPATGGASGPLGGYLVHHAAVPADRAAHMVSLQGVRMGRPSRIHISISTRNGRIDEVRVGGQSVLVAEGTMHL
jgi:trans-2,3-dihydro-3-hydroxyanthranilate isomerase